MKLSPKEIAYNKKMKPYRIYFDSIKAKLNAYLTDTLNRTLVTDGTFKCSNDFNLLFSKNNKLLKVESIEKIDDKEDRILFSECRKKIIATFKSIHFNFVHSQVNYWRKMHLSNGKIVVSD